MARDCARIFVSSSRYYIIIPLANFRFSFFVDKPRGERAMKYSRARNSLRSSPFFFFCAREHPRKQFQHASGSGGGGETGAGRRGRDKNFLIGRIVEHPSQSYNFSIVSKLPDSYPLPATCRSARKTDSTAESLVTR